MTQYANITDAQMVNENVARVVIMATNIKNPEDVGAVLASKLKGAATLVESSLRELSTVGSTTTYLGFVRTQPEVRQVTKREIQASYQPLIASNPKVLVSQEDSSVWDMKEGAGGKFLVRKPETSLQALLTASTSHYTGAPSLNQIHQPMPKKNELVAFVTKDGVTDYGFVTRTSTANQAIEVLSRSSGTKVVISNTVALGSYEVEVPEQLHKTLVANIDPKAKDKASAYWAELFSYAPEYADMMIRDVERGTAG